MLKVLLFVKAAVGRTGLDCTYCCWIVGVVVATRTGGDGVPSFRIRSRGRDLSFAVMGDEVVWMGT